MRAPAPDRHRPRWERRFAGKRGLALHLLALLQTRAPRWRRLCAIEWSAVERFVFVCTGNICRSPYAAAQAQALGLPAVSSGLEAARDAEANETAAAEAARRGIALAGHRTRPLQDLRLTAADLIVCMEPPHCRRIRGLMPEPPGQITLLGLWSRPQRPWIFDPYGISGEYWQSCFDVIDDGVGRIAAAWRERRGEARPLPLTAL